MKEKPDSVGVGRRATLLSQKLNNFVDRIIKKKGDFCKKKVLNKKGYITRKWKKNVLLSQLVKINYKQNMEGIVGAGFRKPKCGCDFLFVIDFLKLLN